MFIYNGKVVINRTGQGDVTVELQEPEGDFKNKILRSNQVTFTISGDNYSYLLGDDRNISLSNQQGLANGERITGVFYGYNGLVNDPDSVVSRVAVIFENPNTGGINLLQNDDGKVSLFREPNSTLEVDPEIFATDLFNSERINVITENNVLIGYEAINE